MKVIGNKLKIIIKYKKKLQNILKLKKKYEGISYLAIIKSGILLKSKFLLTVILISEFFSLGIFLDLHQVKAATTNGTLTATASVASTCTVSGNTIAFGAYTGALADQTGTVTANCTKGTSFSVAMTSVQTSGAYQMTSGLNTLNYKIYTDNGRTAEIVAATNILTDPNSSGNNQNVTIYGRIPAAQIVSVGAYSGTTTFTLTY